MTTHKHLQAALADTSIPTVEVQSAEDPNDEPELEVLDDNAIKLDTSNVPIILSISQVLPRGHRATQCWSGWSALSSCYLTQHDHTVFCFWHELYVCCIQVGTALAVDLTAEDEACSSSALQVAVNNKGRLCSASQRGSSGINPGIVQVWN